MNNHLTKQVQSKVDRIEQAIVANIDLFDSLPISLMSGKGGVLLFFTQNYLLYKKEEHYDLIGELLEKLVQDLNKSEFGLSYCDGLAGIAFLFDYMKSNGLYVDELEDILSDLDTILINTLTNEIIESDIDFLHGKLGIYYYLIQRQSTETIFIKEMDFFVEFIDEYLDGIFLENNGKVFNLGLAHGFCAIAIILIKFSLQYKTNKFDQTLKAISYNILKVKSDDEKSFSLFPSQAADFNNTSMYRIPLGWCYGDQVITLCLDYYSKYSKDKHIQEILPSITNHWKKRNKTELIYPTNLYDEILCHGNSMVAYLNKKWYSETQDSAFLANYNALLMQVLNTDDNIGVAGFRKLISPNVWEDTYSFLDGASGIGIFLLDYLGAPSKWDSFLLLDLNK